MDRPVSILYVTSSHVINTHPNRKWSVNLIQENLSKELDRTLTSEEGPPSLVPPTSSTSMNTPPERSLAANNMLANYLALFLLQKEVSRVVIERKTHITVWGY